MLVIMSRYIIYVASFNKRSGLRIVSEYDQENTQSQTADPLWIIEVK